ncbi:alpha/beta hydrolase [uncultured Kordia sp.]|uniref:alpha/beta hydrolase n=1 Tax=uncultured Kordia sp. TaxID=507699 RepID=UPI0026356302|nr:alpha/beta hydrolase [uncultured Kordia sp.]
MKCIRVFFILIFISQFIYAQKVKDFFYTIPETKELPVFVRGNIRNQKILLFVQGGSAENGIDFGRSNYPKWKKTLEKNVAIAYFDQRGLNKSITKIDTSKINPIQVSKDILLIAKKLHKTYNAEIYLFGHSTGGQNVLDCLATFPKEASFIKAGIAFNAPITTDFSPERYTTYRPLYLKNLAHHFIAKDTNTAYWEKALHWMTATDSIHTPEISRQWNSYVDRAYNPKKRSIGLGMVLSVIFSRPYNPIKYLNQKDNDLVGDLLWKADRNLNRWELLPKIQHPLLLLTGQFDAIAVPEELEVAQKLIPNSELIILPNCGHSPFFDQPKLFEKAVLSFIGVE